ncbi:glycosyl hydrolase [Cyclobacterium jeungdonense]|uniref:Glycosyl hydrolase n=1 Tax=Cyclobacterium jeungdonense TaxID=708087 RepID=A0ABT8CAH7_9BACT|nr:glycosyl hydrolase [Cyclobacterium jeungdonense]MDN3689540.1 glycosyl hydrolase [Cyclobacterium jeungdonense]
MARIVSKRYLFDISSRNPAAFPLLLVIWMFFFAGSGCTSRQEKEKSEAPLSGEIFRNPATEYRPLALWTWMNGYVDAVKLVEELEEMKDKGLRGAIIWDIGALINPDDLIPDGPAFLGPESLQYISLALTTSHSLGLDLGISSASSWNSGGEWIDVPNGSKELLNTAEWVEGPSTIKLELKNPESSRGIAKNCELLTVIAIPQNPAKVYDPKDAITLSASVNNGRLVEWQVPEGRWEILSFFSCNTMQPLVVPSPNSAGLIIDHLSKKATELHFEELFSRLDQISTPQKQMDFIFLDSYEVWEMMDWTPEFMREFEDRYAYDPRPYLPLLQGFYHSDSLIQDRFEADYRRLVSNLLIENHYAKTVEIGEERGIQMVTEAGHGGSPRVEPLKALGNSHIPMGEFWNRQRHWVTKEAASAAHIYGKNIVASESLTGWNHWQHGPTDFKQLIDIAFCEGLNQVVFHTFSHNPEIAGKPGFVYHAGEHVNVNATWWEMARPFMDYIARCSYMLRQGNFVADVLLYYGDEAPNLVPPGRMDPNYTPDMPGIFPTYFYDESKCPHCGRPKPINPGNLQGYQSDYINEDVITKTLATENGNLVLPHGQSYKILMLPDRKDISLEVLKRLETLIFNGAVVIGRKPERSTSLKNYPASDQEVRQIANKIWGDCDGEKVLSNKYGKGTIYWGKSAREVLEERAIPPDFQVTGIDNTDLHIDFVHRQTESEAIFFLSNSSEKQEKISGVFRVDPDSKPELWDAETGLIQRQVEFAKVDNGLQMEITMDPLASRFVVFRKGTSGINDEGLYHNLQTGLKDQLNSKVVYPAIDLSKQWNIAFDPDMGGPESLKLDSLVSWSELEDEGASYYSGSAIYTREFIIDDDVPAVNLEAFVSFEEIQEMAQVFVNGNDCGIIWLPPYATRITPHLKQGRNTITVKVINTWNNRIVGDLRNPEKIPFTQTNARGKFTSNSPLLQSGLLGKAEINFITKK